MDLCPGIVAINKLNSDIIDNPLSLTLGGNKLVLKNGEVWTSESTDLDEALQRQRALVAENDALKVRLMVVLEELEGSARETADLKSLKLAAMDMLADQRIKNLQLEAQLTECKRELKESYRAAVDLKNSFNSFHAKVEVDD